MAGSTFLSKFLSAFGNYRSILTNRIIYHQVTANLTSKSEVEILKKPKRPLSSYFRFLNEQRPLLHKQLPNLTSLELIKRCGVMWNNLNDSQKEKYRQEYKKDAAAYKDVYNKYLESLTEEQEIAIEQQKAEKQKKRKLYAQRKVNRENGKPKRPIGCYNYFVQERIPQMEKIGRASNYMSVLKEEWKALTPEQKQKYVDMQDEDKLRYEREIREWEKQMLKEGKTELVRKHSPLLRNMKK